MPELREAGVDYLTVTAASPARRWELEDIGRSFVGREEAQGNRARPWAWKGYVGATAGSATYGTRSDGTLLRVSSGAASDVTSFVLPWADRVTRLDLAVTMRFPRAVPDLLRTQYERACARARELGPALRCGAIVNNQGGATLVLGSRQSNRYGRLYDKEHESNDPKYQNCWRWEVEYKGDAASMCAAALRSGAEPGSTALASVHAFFEGRGVECPWDEHNGLEVPGPGKPHTDAERQVLWLRTQVRPVIARLVPLYTREGIEAILGLTIPELS